MKYLTSLKNAILDFFFAFNGAHPWSWMLRVSTSATVGCLAMILGGVWMGFHIPVLFWVILVWVGMFLWVEILGRTVLSYVPMDHIGYHAGLAYFAVWGILIASVFYLFGFISDWVLATIVVVSLGAILVDQSRRLGRWIRGLFA